MQAVDREKPNYAALMPRLSRKSERGFLETAQKRMKDWRELMYNRATRTELPM